MLTVFDSNDYIFDALKAGVVGYILKKSSSQEIINAINDVQKGESVITPSVARKVIAYFPAQGKTINTKTKLLTTCELAILNLVAKGYTYRMASIELNISIETIRTYIKRIYTKLQVQSNTEAVSLGIKKGLVG